ncbi:MAG: serpin family protein [Myxococcales bacterium]|nr:serpin family protein [Myxococcales bacterium]
MTNCKTAILATSLLLTAGCESKKTAGNEAPTMPSEPSVATETVPATPTEMPTATPVDETPAAAIAAGDPAPLVAASNALAFDLYQTQSAESCNLMFSPVRISLAFTMTYAGANGATADEMERVLHLPEDAELHGAAVTLLNKWGAKDVGYELKVVNRLFGEAAYSFEKPFLDVTKGAYQTPIESLDFKGDPEAQHLHINKWVLEQTNERIADLLPEDSIKKDRRLVLTNAVYFLGSWANAFDADITTKLPFFVGGTKKESVPIMMQVDKFGFARVD